MNRRGFFGKIATAVVASKVAVQPGSVPAPPEPVIIPRPQDPVGTYVTASSYSWGLEPCTPVCPRCTRVFLDPCGYHGDLTAPQPVRCACGFTGFALFYRRQGV